MAKTAISDIIVPDVFIPYVIEKTSALSALVQSGIVVPDSALDALAQTGGKVLDMPFFTDLDGADEILSDSGSLTVGKIGTAQDKARLHMRGRAWAVNDLAKSLSGADPMGAIAQLVAEYWNRMEQATLIASLTGVFADNIANDSSDLVSDVALEEGTAATSANLMGSDVFIDATAKLGDAASKLTATIMHSVPFARLQKLDLIETERDSEQGIEFSTYLGKRVIVDDTCPTSPGSTDGTKYTSYLFGQGAIGRGEGSPDVPVETDRDSLASDDILIHRRHFILHPRGIAFTDSSIAGASPTNAELAEGAQWNRVYEKKNIRIVKLVTNG